MIELTKENVAKLEKLPYREQQAILDQFAKEWGYVAHYFSHYAWLGPDYKDLPEGFNMMATKALHMLGDISRDKPDLVSVWGELPDYWVGMWYTGYGMVDVKFPKETTRKLTQKEANYFNKRAIQISNQPPVPIKIKESDIAS